MEYKKKLLTEMKPDDGQRIKQSSVFGSIGFDEDNNKILFELNQSNPHLILVGQNKSDELMLIKNMVYSAMLATTPEDLKILFLGKSDKNVESSEAFKNNPFLLKTTHDTDMLDFLIQTLKTRMSILRESNHTRVEDYNSYQTSDKMPEILVIIDSISEFINADGESVDRNNLDKLAYLVRMSGSQGVNFIIGDTVSSIENLPDVIRYNVLGRVFLGTMGIAERELLFPDLDFDIDKVQHDNEFYSLMSSTDVHIGYTPQTPEEEFVRLNHKFSHEYPLQKV